MSIIWNTTPHPVTEGLTDQCCMRGRVLTSIILHSIYVLILQRFVELLTVKIAGHLMIVRKKLLCCYWCLWSSSPRETSA